MTDEQAQKFLLELNPFIPVEDDERTNPEVKGGQWHTFYAIIESGIPKYPRSPIYHLYVRYRDLVGVVGTDAANQLPEVQRLLGVLNA